MSDDSDDDSSIGLGNIDFSGVDFDKDDSEEMNTADKALIEWESNCAFQIEKDVPEPALEQVVNELANGEYSSIIRSIGRKLLPPQDLGAVNPTTVICHSVLSYGTSSITACIEIEILAVAALNLFLQANYTGPSLEDLPADTLSQVNPHCCFNSSLKAQEESVDGSLQVDEAKKEKLTDSAQNSGYQNSVLALLAVEGSWPCQVCHGPYFLLIARTILSMLANPTSKDWYSLKDVQPSAAFLDHVSRLSSVHLWHARAIVVHERLLQSREPSSFLWDLAETAFSTCIHKFCTEMGNGKEGARVMLEFGLAQHHFNRPGSGRASFWKAKDLSGLSVEVTGAQGKRTKFQQKATAQMVVRAQSTSLNDTSDTTSDVLKGQMVEHTAESILLERVNFEEDKENEVTSLTTLDQAILMALCLDVKNSNPADGLTNEEMAAFLARVLDHQDDWMVYSTALLERSWLEFERSHARERAILQMQALADQHTNRLTLTQSTKKSVEESAPVQIRLQHLHSIVYPPRWLMLRDLADRYAALGIVSSAAELYADVEDWDDVVDCYQRAGKDSRAEQIVRERLQVKETPRMLSALGDLTKDPEHYKRAIELSNGRYADAYIALGQHYFDNGSLSEAAEQFEKSLKVRRLSPATWFRLGTISMQLSRWETALRAFSEVVTQEPEEQDAWANVAAIHMRNKKPAEAYPALVQSLKYGRNNWKVWTSKLYVCLDLEKYDEAVQACNVLLDLRSDNQASDGVPPLEERCVRAAVGGALKQFHDSKGDETAADSTRRTLSRVHGLLDRISSTSDAEPWIFETLAFLHEQAGDDKEVLEHLMMEYRALTAVPAWERDDLQVKKVTGVVLQITRLHVGKGSKESLTKARFLLRGVAKRVDTARQDDLPQDVERLRQALDDVAKKIDALR